MRTLWQGLVRIVFWSFERGTWPYDVAVAVIVVFVLFSPRSWFNDRPPVSMMPEAAEIVSAMVELRGTDPVDGAPIYRVDARLISRDEPNMEQALRDAVRKHASQPPRNSEFEILRIASVRGSDGAIAYYDICIKP
jgi:hypothetical protein